MNVRGPLAFSAMPKLREAPPAPAAPVLAEDTPQWLADLVAVLWSPFGGPL